MNRSASISLSLQFSQLTEAVARLKNFQLSQLFLCQSLSQLILQFIRAGYIMFQFVLDLI